MFSNLSERLTSVVRDLRGRGRLTEENIDSTLRDVRMALLEGDVALPVVKDFIDKIKARALGEEVIGTLTPGQVKQQLQGASAIPGQPAGASDFKWGFGLLDAGNL